jgi:ABC-type antimicrobial peptide transport system permease subunit
MTIKENIEIAMTMSDIDAKTRNERTMDLLKLIGLSDYANKTPNQLSGGQKQRVAIARALANNPTIILADEPTGALDAASAEVVMQILKKIAELGKLVIIVTHSEKVASECSRVIKMEDGVISDDRVVNKLHIDSKRDKEIKPKSITTKELYKISSRNIKQKKNRSLLVSLGMAIGMAAVLLILCLSSGLSSYVNNVYADSLQSLQIVATTNSKKSATFDSNNLSVIGKLDGVSSVTESYTTQGATYSYGSDTSSSGSLEQLSCYFIGTYQPELLYGEYKQDTDDTKYIIINEALARSISTDGTLIGSVGTEISISKTSSSSFTIAGIFSNDSMSKMAYISKSSMETLMDSTSLETNTIIITAKDTTYVSAIKEDVESLGFSISTSESDSDKVLKYIDIGTTALTAVGAVSMIVSAIMIFIVLYISVSERMKEIGILRAIGARRKDIKKMFVFEAGLLGVMGGIFAVVICFVVTLITNIICLSTLHYGLISYNILYYVLGILVSVIISVLAGIAPAIRASDLDPVESLRAE